MVAALAPNAQRIAQIIRSNEQDLALMTQQRRLADAAVCAPGAFSLAPGGIAAGAVVDSKVGQLAERVSVLMAGVQQRCEADKQDVERRLEDLDARADARARALEARLAACERGGAEGGVAPSLREVHAAIDTGLSDASGRWSGLLAELRSELRSELGGRLDELAERARLQASRLQQAEAVVEDHEQSLERSAGLLREHEERLQCLFSGLEQERALGDQLEGAVANLERCYDELRVASEAEQQRLRLDLQALRHRSADSLLGLRNDVSQMVEARLESELALFGAELCSARQQTSAAPAPPERRRSGDELGRRLEDAEARLSALRIRVDGQDGRLAGLVDRTEAAGKQAQEEARQASLQQREDILSEADCQLRIVRQRVDTLSELCEELLLRQGPGGAGRAHRALEAEELAPLHRRVARSSSRLR